MLLLILILMFLCSSSFFLLTIVKTSTMIFFFFGPDKWHDICFSSLFWYRHHLLVHYCSIPFCMVGRVRSMSTTAMSDPVIIIVDIVIVIVIVGMRINFDDIQYRSSFCGFVVLVLCCRFCGGFLLFSFCLFHSCQPGTAAVLVGIKPMLWWMLVADADVC